MNIRKVLDESVAVQVLLQVNGSNKEQTQTQITRKLNSCHAANHQNIKELKQEGLLNIKKVKRKTSVTLTHKGEKVKRLINRIYDELNV